MSTDRILKHREEELMEFMWTRGGALTIADMEKGLDEDEWNHVTLYRTVRTLIDMGYLRVCGAEKGRTQYHRMIEATLTREEYAARWLKDRDIRLKDLSSVVVAMLGDGRDAEDSDELIEELESMIDELRNEAKEE